MREVCWHECPICRKEYSHEVKSGSPLDQYFSTCQSCRPDGVVGAYSITTAKNIVCADDDEGNGQGALVGIAREAFTQAGEGMPSEFELLAVPEENDANADRKAKVEAGG
jgi:hypothetical protein